MIRRVLERRQARLAPTALGQAVIRDRPSGSSDPRGRRLLVGALSAILMTGCADDEQDLRVWMREQRRIATPRAEQLPPPKQFEPFLYDSAGLPDPFAAARLQAQLRESAAGMKGPDLRRPREVLEGYPLESIRLVGHLRDARGDVALLQVDRLVHQARVGNYLGQNFGRILGISETELRLTEMVQDGTGDWVVRDATLQLTLAQEKKTP